jgi:hypothetical protein
MMRNARLVVPVVLSIVPFAINPAPVAAQDTLGPPTAILADGPREGDRSFDFSLPWASKDTTCPGTSPRAAPPR